MKLFESALYTLKKYADFSGRASREEFWLFFVFVIIANANAIGTSSSITQGTMSSRPDLLTS